MEGSLMRARLLAIALVIVVGACKDEAGKPAPPLPTAPKDAQVNDATIGPILDLAGCVPAPMPPGEPYPQLGRGRAIPNADGMGMGGLTGRTIGGSGAWARVTLGTTKENGLKGAAAVLRQHENRLRFCYEQNLVRNPSLAGKSQLQIIIQDSTHPHEVIVDNSIDDELALCMKHIVMELEFPKPAKPPVTIVQPLTFEWKAGVNDHANIPFGWTPYARTQTPVPSEPAIVAALAVQKAISTAKLAACLGPQHTGSMRAVLRVGTDGNVFDAKTGGFGDGHADACLASALIGTKTDPLPLMAEVACDFTRGDPAAWRVARQDAGYRELGPHARDDDEGGNIIKPEEQTYLLIIDPAMTVADIKPLLAAAVRGAAYVVAIEDDPKRPPLFLLAGRGVGVVPDPAAPLTLDAREPLTICHGLLDASVSMAFTEAPSLLANAARRCTKKPCPTQLTISLAPERNADQLATLVAAARRAGFERVRFGEGVCR